MRLIKGIMILAGFFALAAGVILAIRAPRFSEPVILHVDPVLGVDLVGSMVEALGTFGVGFLMVAVHLILATVFLERARLLAQVSAAAAAFFALLLLISTSYIVSLN